MIDSKRLSPTAKFAIAEAEAVSVCAISLFEIGIKVRAGKWDEMAPFATELPTFAHDQGIGILALDADAAQRAAMLEWGHADPFDRMIAASTMSERATLVTRDRALHDFEQIDCIW